MTEVDSIDQLIPNLDSSKSLELLVDQNKTQQKTHIIEVINMTIKVEISIQEQEEILETRGTTMELHTIELLIEELVLQTLKLNNIRQMLGVEGLLISKMIQTLLVLVMIEGMIGAIQTKRDMEEMNIAHSIKTREGTRAAMEVLKDKVMITDINRIPNLDMDVLVNEIIKAQLEVELELDLMSVLEHLASMLTQDHIRATPSNKMEDL